MHTQLHTHTHTTRRYVVLNRPYAFVQWVKQAKIPERYVLMSEPDHIFLRPLPNFMNGEVPGKSVGWLGELVGGGG